MSSLPSLSPRTLAVGNAVAFIVNTIIITFTSNAPIYGKTNSQVSNMFDPPPHRLLRALFTLQPPTPRTQVPHAAHTLWLGLLNMGAIFAAQGVWTAWQVIPRNHSNRFTASIGVWWWIVCAVQCCWTFAFAQEQIGLARTHFMLAILLALVGIAAALSKHRAVVRPSSPA